jgi:two-component system response regulator YesN
LLTENSTADAQTLRDPLDLYRQKSAAINWRAFRYYSALNKVRSHWSQHPDEGFSLTEAADIAAMTPTYFSRFFRHTTGVTFKYWIDLMRVRYAASLIRRSNKTVIEVLSECGFKDPTTFTRTFRRITGLTPIDFKRASKPFEKDEDKKRRNSVNFRRKKVK